MESPCSSETSVHLYNWREKRQRLFIYWCFTNFIHGMIHSIRYSSQYLYFKDVMRVSNPDFLYGLSVSFIGASGVIFPLFISPLIDRTRKIKQAIFVVNILGLFGNLLYALPFSPALPLIGQLLAGTTPAFGVIAMGEISRCYSSKKLTKRVSALSLIYSIGTFTSIGLVFTFLYIDFDIGKLHINYANMPGIFLALAFALSTLLAPCLVSDISKEFDLKLEERIKRSSGGSTPKKLSSTEPTPDLSTRSSSAESEDLDQSDLQQVRSSNKTSIPKISEPKAKEEQMEKNKLQITRDVGQPFYFNIDKKEKSEEDLEMSRGFSFPSLKANKYTKLNTNDQDVSQKKKKFNAAHETCASIWKILRHRTTALLMIVTFMEAFVYSIIVTSLPVLAAKFLYWGKVELALLSMVNKFLSVLISGSVYFLTDYLQDVLLLMYGTMLSLLALIALAVLPLVEKNNSALTVLLFAIAALSIAGVPLIITSTRTMLAKIVPTEIQALTEAVRMSVFEASFVPAGFLVPLVTMNVSLTAIILFTLLLGILVYAVRQLKNLVDIREEDEYWLSADNSTYTS